MTHRIPTDVAWTSDVDEDGATRTFVARLPRGPIHVLEGTAALIWACAVAHDAAPLTERVAEEAGVRTEDIRAEVETFVGDLVARRLLSPDNST